MKFKFKISDLNLDLMITVLSQFIGSHRATDIRSHVEFEILKEILSELIRKQASDRPETKVTWSHYQAIVFFYLVNPYIQNCTLSFLQTINNRIHQEIIINVPLYKTELQP